MFGNELAAPAAAEAVMTVPATRTGIGNLSLKKSAPTTAAADPAPDTPPTNADDDTVDGGKGGKEGQPALPPSNAAFMANVIRDVADDARAVVCSKPGDPTEGGWPAEIATDVDRQCPADRNNYLNCSTFTVDQADDIQATKDRFSAFRFVMLDDVGTKVDRSKLEGITPTWEIETSPGNSQVGFRLTHPLRDLAAVKALQDAVMAAGLCDRGAGGAGRWARLPSAINGKAKHRDGAGAPFSCRLIRWHPDISYTVDQLADMLGLTLGVHAQTIARSIPVRSSVPATEMIANDVFTPAPATNPVVAALAERGLYKRQIAAGRHDVTCPWLEEHTDGIDGGTAYFEPDADRAVGGFKCQHSHGDRYRIGQLLDFLGVEPEQARCKVRIDIAPGEINRVRRASELALALQGGYYQAGGVIVVVRTDPASGDITTELLGEAALGAALSDAADWFRFDGRSNKSVRCDPPIRNVQALLKSQHFEHLPVLTGLARQPFFREIDGELVTAPGYDAKSGRFAAFDAARFPLSAPTSEAARRALDLLNDLLDEFRFATPEDRSAALCAMLTAAVRPSLPTAPAFNITASTPGSGKSYLASTITPLAGPGAPLKVSYPSTADEASKAMLSICLGAPASVVFDDMQGPWQPFGAINRMLTSPTITDRVLGVSRTVTAGTRSLVMGTGNNVGPVRDMMRRIVTIRLHHPMATPALERYAGRPAEMVASDRGRYVSAAITIIAAYRQAGSPKAEVPSIASYGEWSDMCRQPLLWLGLPDPATSLIEQVQHDPDQDDLGTLLIAWHHVFGDRVVTLRKVVEESLDAGDLQDALLDLPVVERESINRSKLGWYLRRNANRVVNGLELRAAPHSERKGWRVVAIQPS